VSRRTRMIRGGPAAFRGPVRGRWPGDRGAPPARPAAPAPCVRRGLEGHGYPGCWLFTAPGPDPSPWPGSPYRVTGPRSSAPPLAVVACWAAGHPRWSSFLLPVYCVRSRVSPSLTVRPDTSSDTAAGDQSRPTPTAPAPSAPFPLYLPCTAPLTLLSAPAAPSACGVLCSPIVLMHSPALLCRPRSTASWSRYFTAINAHDYSSNARLLVPARRAQCLAAAFARGYGTTHRQPVPSSWGSSRNRAGVAPR